jgi:hypothetical protein
MSFHRRTHGRVAVLAIAGTFPLLAALTACSSSTSPRSSSPGVDTVVADLALIGGIERDSNNVPGDSTVTYELYLGEGGSMDAGRYSNGSGSTNYEYEDRGIFGYVLPKLAGLGVVDSAKAYVYECGYNNYTTSQSPMGFGQIDIDHVAFGDVIQGDSTTFNSALQTDMASSTDSTFSYKGFGVTAAVQADYAAKRAASQYRFRYVFNTYPSAGYLGDFVYFGTDCDQGGGLPYLVIWSH